MNWTTTSRLIADSYTGVPSRGSDRWLLERMGRCDWILWYSGFVYGVTGERPVWYPVSRLVTPDGDPLRMLAGRLQSEYLDRDGSSCQGDASWTECREGLVNLCLRNTLDTKRGCTIVVDTLDRWIERTAERCPLKAVEVDF
jgi:hypothetical protein